MEPDVLRMYSSSPPPMEDGGADEDEDEFGDFSGVPGSVSFTEFDTPATPFDRAQALNATSPPELLNNGGLLGRPRSNGVARQGDRPTGRTASGVEELKRAAEHPRAVPPRPDSLHSAGSGRTEVDAVGCNGGADVLTNGFAALDAHGTPPAPRHKGRCSDPDSSADFCLDAGPGDEDDDFADFSAFSNTNAPSHLNPATEHSADRGDRSGGEGQAEEHACRSLSGGEQGESSDKGNARDANATGPEPFSILGQASEGLRNGDWGCRTTAAAEQRRDLEADTARRDAESARTERPLALNGLAQEEDDEEEEEDEGMVGNRASASVAQTDEEEGEQTDEKGSGNDTETETETSFGRPLSTDALEEFGDFSTTGSMPSPPLQEDTATPADDEDFGDFGDFGDAGSIGGQGFADLDQPAASAVTRGGSADTTSDPAREVTEAGEEEFGDFDTSREHGKTRGEGLGGEEGATFADFPGSDSFADFSSAPVEGEADGGWNAFDEPEEGDQGEGESWAAFGSEQSTAPSEKSQDEWPESQAAPAPPTGSEEDSRRGSLTASLVGRLEKLFQASFPEFPVPQVGDEVPPLKAFLEPPKKSTQEGEDRVPVNKGLRDVWQQLQDIHNAFGLRHQWGGSHSNKMLLCSLGIDTRNILFTGQKKQPVIVPMYAASLGMLEPTKEPVKPVSAAEMIASIAQTPPVASSEISPCPPDTAQETLPPVQFDWSSSGLTNPLDASGGSSLLNLDFFGPVEESASSAATSIPGVDPELYELTTAKLDQSGGGSRVADAFARLMSTVEKTSTSTRKPRKEEHLSAEAVKVIASLPDLSFMQAKVLMFPATLTPLGSSSTMPD